VNERRQLAYENDTPWFPADFPATKAGQQWEYDESNRRKADWARKPKSRKTAYESVYLGNGKKGEIGVGWECDWQHLVQDVQSDTGEELIIAEVTEEVRPTTDDEAANDTVMEAASKPPAKAVQEATDANIAQSSLAVQLNQPLHLIPSSTASRTLIHGAKIELPENALATIKITMLTRGRPSDCARVYRLPTNDPELHKKWLAQQPSPQTARTNNKRAKVPLKPDVAASAMVQRSWLAAVVLTKPAEPGHKDYPIVPGEEDLIGFVTTGNFSLKEGKGVGIGSVLLGRILPDEGSWEAGAQGKQVLKREHFLCIVRDAGESHGRLAAWSLV
jgi:ribonuclease P/MRP protein subunit POP1